MNSKLILTVAAALSLAIGSAAASAKTVAPPAPVDSKNTGALDKDNTQIQKNAARIAAACSSLRTISLENDPFTFNMDLNEIRADETNLNYLAAKKAFDKGLSSVNPDPNDHSFDYLGSVDQILGQICGISGHDGGGG
jgi:hypothetical protein